MNCINVCRQIATDPEHLNHEISTHLAHCGSCRAFAKSQQQFSKTLNRATRIKPPEELAAKILLRQSLQRKNTFQFRLRAVMAIATVFVLAIGLVIGIQQWNSPLSLQQSVITHIKNEQHHLYESNSVSQITLKKLLEPHHIKLVHSLANVHYASACPIRQFPGVHLIIQGTNGPVTILLMPNEHISRTMPITDSRFNGRLIPVSNGSIAIVGENNENLNEIEIRLQRVFAFNPS